MADREPNMQGLIETRSDIIYQCIYNDRYTYRVVGTCSAGKILEAATNLSICVNFKVFSFVMTYNNKKDDAIFRCHITFMS